MSDDELKLKQSAEITSKKYTLQRVLDENLNQCLILLQYFSEPKWVNSESIKNTKEYIEFKKRKQEILKE